jgi:hypothetical protein
MAAILTTVGCCGRLAPFSDLDCTVWAARTARARMNSARAMPKQLDAASGAFPRLARTCSWVSSNSIALVGSIARNAERVIVFCQPAAPDARYIDQLREIARHGGRPVELVFLSQAMADRFGQGSYGAASADRPRTRWRIAGFAGGGWRRCRPAWPLGIVGQNQQAVLRAADGDFINGWPRSPAVCTSTILGASATVWAGSPKVHFFEKRPERVRHSFSTQLACFVHRAQTVVAGHGWPRTVRRDGSRRAGAVPAALDSRRAIEHGVDGLVYRSSAEARELLSDLRQSPATAAAMGVPAVKRCGHCSMAVRQERSYRNSSLEAASKQRRSSEPV